MGKSPELQPDQTQGIVSEFASYALHHPLKAAGNTAIAAYGLWMAGHGIELFTRQLKPKEEPQEYDR